MEILKEINSIKELFDFQILNYIAQGSFGKVYYALEKKTNKEVAIKVFILGYSTKIIFFTKGDGYIKQQL